jgi:Tfp pilus assembly protein PilV
MPVQEESGATLVETLVALSILVAVLLPVLLFLGYLSHSPRNRDRIQAIGLAQTMMETTLEQKDFVTKKEPYGRKWMIRQQVIHNKRLVGITVRVFRKQDTLAIASFYTERLAYQSDTLSTDTRHGKSIIPRENSNE